MKLETETIVQHDEYEEATITVDLKKIKIEVHDFGDGHPNSRIELSHKDFHRIKGVVLMHEKLADEAGEPVE